MITNGVDPHIAISDSFVAWWRDAGVDYCTDGEAYDWLAAPVVEPVAVQPKSPVRQATSEVPSPEPVSVDQWPKSLESLHQAIMAGAGLPGTAYSAARAAPIGPLNAEWMILTDLPEEADVAAGRLGEGPSGALLRAMLAAINIDLSQCYLAALAHSRPATGSLPTEAHDVLARFAKHHIDLANPQRILLLGSSATELLLGQDLMAARADLPNIKHIVENRAAVMTFHPRTLLARPILKAQAWRDLQILAKKDFS